jgi:hypothetical protein
VSWSYFSKWRKNEKYYFKRKANYSRCNDFIGMRILFEAECGHELWFYWVVSLRRFVRQCGLRLSELLQSVCGVGLRNI